VLPISWLRPSYQSHFSALPVFISLIVTEMLQKSHCGAFVRNID
jgi:hypothetical protein